MLSNTPLPNAPTDGRTASKDPLNSEKCRLPAAKPWIGGGPKWMMDEISHLRASVLPAAELFFRHGGWIDQLSGKCRSI
jgi:hypothetical protein